VRHQAECDFYNALRAAHNAGIRQFDPCEAHNSEGELVSGDPFDVTTAALGIPYKRAIRWLEKWDARGWWGYASNPQYSWFTDNAPLTLEP
jgi:hypothetical protein